MSIETTARVKFLESDLPKLVLAAPLSRETTFTLRVDGPWGAREAANLLKLLAAHLEVMRETDEELRAAAANFHMAYRMKCDEATKVQAVEIEQLRAALDELIECNNLQHKMDAYSAHDDWSHYYPVEAEHGRRAPLAWAEARKLRGKT